MDKFKTLKKLSIMTLTIIMCLLWYNVNKPNAYEICISGKPIMYVQNINDFNKSYEESINYISKNYNSNINPKININRVKVNKDYLFTNSEMKKTLLKTIKVPAVIMKCNGTEVGTLLNKEDMKKVIQLVKEDYIKNNQDFTIGQRKSKVTYIDTDVSINKISKPENISKNILTNKELKPLLVFETTKKKATLVKNNPKATNNKKGKSVATSGKVNMLNIPALGMITSNFGMRYNPILKCKKFHSGVDIGAPIGTSIYAALDGTVTFVGWIEGYGNTIKIQHDSKTEVLYAHCNKIIVKKGQKIAKSKKIGYVGNTGRSTGPHVHFEVRENGKAVNPIKYLK